MIELPPPPYGASPTYGYTEAEMRAYGEACARAAIEAAAELCEAGMRGTSAPYADACHNCATHIRALIGPSSPSSSQTQS
jgi:hypothetical protein